MKRPFGSRRVALFALLIVAVLLAGCGTLLEDTRDAIIKDPREVSAPGPPCQYFDWGPFRNIKLSCTEVIYDNVTPPQAAPALLGLALGPDGTLYFARTAAGEVWAVRDADGDQYMDAPYLVAEGLYLPTHLAVTADALFVATLDGLLRFDALASDAAPRFGDPVVLVADIGRQADVWPGEVRVGPDARLYVGISAQDDRPGAVVSFAPDGTDRRVVATGLRDPADFVWHPQTGDLWILDSRGARAAYDALFRVPAAAAAAPDFGYPACLDGTESACADAAPPAFTFEDQSAPSGAAFYTGEDWPFWTGSLLVTLAGSWNRVVPTGYAVEAVAFGADGLPTGASEIILPSAESTWAATSLDGFSLAGMGLYPEHPSDVVIDANGWLYIGLWEGRIYRMRPRPTARQ